MNQTLEVKLGKKRDKPYCSHCKRDDVTVTPNSRTKYGGKYYQYYLCRECNTDRFRKYRKTKIGRNNTYKAVYKSIKKYQDKQRARVMLNWNIKNGKIIKPKCCFFASCNSFSKISYTLGFLGSILCPLILLQ